MFYLSPIEQGQKSVLFYTSSHNLISKSYANIIIPTPGISSLLVDGTPVPASKIKIHPNNPAYSVAIPDLSNTMDMQHTITSDSVFTATVYGLGAYESYGYNIGCNINNLNNYSGIKNTLNTNGQTDTFTCPKTPVRLYAKLAYQANSIHWKLSRVPGISPNADSIISNPVPIGIELINGRTYYVYTLQQDFIFAAPGIYKIPISYAAAIIENCNQTENAELIVVVKQGPATDFSISNQLCLADTVRFTGTTPAWLFNFTNYLWNFDDATTQNTINAKKRFAASGNHDVRYRVYADNGCIGDTTKTINIVNGTGPALAVTVTGKPCVDSSLLFTSSILPGANPTTWYWDFGDGPPTTSLTNTISHAYTTAATNRVVKHTATITNGCSPDTIQYIIPNIYANPGMPSFTITADTLCIRKPLQFTSSTTGVSLWNWSFGNGNGNQTPPFTYSYNTAGSYSISLSIKDNNGCGSPAAVNGVIINPNPVISAGPDKIISVGSSTTLDASIANPGNYNFLWTPSVYLNSSSILNPISTPNNTPVIYTITATDKTTFCSGNDIVIVSPISKLYIPSGFTPNNDGKNDVWNIPGMALYPDGIVMVFNRWGEKIFETKGYFSNPWNGKYKGLLQPHDVYVYIIQLTNDKSKVIKGTVTIIQ